MNIGDRIVVMKDHYAEQHPNGKRFAKKRIKIFGGQHGTIVQIHNFTSTVSVSLDRDGQSGVITIIHKDLVSHKTPASLIGIRLNRGI